MPTSSAAAEHAHASRKGLLSAILLIVLLLWISPKSRSSSQGSIVLEPSTELKLNEDLEQAVWRGRNTTLERRFPPQPFTNGPTFVGFPDTNTENMARAAFLDIFHLSLAAMRAVCDRSAEYHNYFDDGDWQAVYNIFNGLYGGGAGPPEMNFMDKFGLAVAYGDRARFGDPDLCVIDRTLYGFMSTNRPDGLGSALMICPSAFTDYSITLSTLTCEPFLASPWIKEELRTLGVHLIHEMMHYPTFTNNYAGGNTIGDYGWVGVDYAYPVGQPYDGYGPYNAQRLKANRGHAPKDPPLNADNFALMAFEAYWAYKCGTSFQLVSDALAGQPPPPPPAVPQPPDAVIDTGAASSSASP